MNTNRHILLFAILLTIFLSIACMLFVPSGGSLKFDPDRLPDAQVRTPYEAEIHVTQNRTPVGDFAISDGSTRPGLELKKVEGVEDTARISGIPQEVGPFTFKIS